MVQYQKSDLNQMGESAAPAAATSNVHVSRVPRRWRRVCGAALTKIAGLPAPCSPPPPSFFQTAPKTLQQIDD